MGNFVLVNSMLIQLGIPLNFMGMIYRQIRQSIIDIENMMEVLEQQEEVSG